MDEFAHPRVVVGIDESLHGLAALRAAVAEARRRHIPLHVVRCHNPVQVESAAAIIDAAFHEALGSVPGDVEICAEIVSGLPADSLVARASDPRDLIVVGNSGKSALRAMWSGSISAGIVRAARCPVMAVPAPEMARAVRGRRQSHVARGDLWHQFDQAVVERPGKRRVDN